MSDLPWFCSERNEEFIWERGGLGRDSEKERERKLQLGWIVAEQVNFAVLTKKPSTYIRWQIIITYNFRSRDLMPSSSVFEYPHICIYEYIHTNYTILKSAEYINNGKIKIIALIHDYFNRIKVNNSNGIILCSVSQAY